MQVPGIPEAAGASPAGGGGAAAALAQFADPEQYMGTALALTSSVALAAVLAYHPSTRRKITTREGLEQPKTLVLYGLVGALVGHIVQLNQMMALVVFGIGGLMRFRTIVGEAKDTGRVILAAIVGICCGLGSYLVAVLATAFGWLIIWYLERETIGSVQVLGVETERMQAASARYRALLVDAGCRVVGEDRNPKKQSLEIVFVAPSHIDRMTLETKSAALPEPERGVAAWELS